VAQAADKAIASVEKQLPRGFPKRIRRSVKAGLRARLQHHLIDPLSIISFTCADRKAGVKVSFSYE
jgi:hypothetical protein